MREKKKKHFFGHDPQNPPPTSHFYPRYFKHLGCNQMNFVKSVESFLADAYWLNASHAPSVAALKALAVELDREVTAALIAQFGVLHRSLLKEKPREVVDTDPLAELLRR